MYTYDIIWVLLTIYLLKVMFHGYVKVPEGNKH